MSDWYFGLLIFISCIPSGLGLVRSNKAVLLLESNPPICLLSLTQALSN